MSSKPTILMYHGIGYSSPTAVQNHYRISPDQFRDQLQWLVDHGYRGISVKDYFNSDNKSTNNVIITFDDGESNNYYNALPILQSFNMSATFYITTQNIGIKGWLNNQQIEEMHFTGMQIAAHGHTHKFFSEMNIMEIKNELNISKTILEQIIGDKVLAMSLPGGRGLNVIEPIAKDIGYRSIATSAPIILKKHNFVTILPRKTITGSTTQYHFSQTVQKAGLYFWYQQIRFLIGWIAKKLMGDVLYNHLWELAINKMANMKVNT